MLFEIFVKSNFKTRRVKKEEVVKEHKYNRENMYFVAC